MGLQTKTAPQPLTYLDVALAVLAPAQGLEYLEARDPIPGQTVLIKAYFELMKRGADKKAEALKKWTERQYPSKVKGRNAPHVGERRKYKIQNQGGLDFARIPVALLGLSRGEECLATFKAGQIVISLPPPKEEGSKVVRLRRKK